MIPDVRGEDAYWAIKESARESQPGPDHPEYQAIEMPRNSATGFVTGFFATITGFALIWHIWWLVILGLVAAYAVFVRFAWRDMEHYEIPADEVARIDQPYREVRSGAMA